MKWAQPRTWHDRPFLAPWAPPAAILTVALIVVAGGYGYHRDELYFLQAGRHLAWGYVDQGPLTPLLALGMNELAPGSLTMLRVPAALMAGGTVLLSAKTASELGGGRRAQLIAASCTAVASVVLVIGHSLSTSSFDLLAWTLVIWLIARVLRSDDHRLWLAVGVVAGLALLNKPLIAFLIVGLGIALLLVGPRELLRSGWLWAALMLALLLWSPWLIWQADHGWPQLAVSSHIAAGGSASSQPRWALLPFQFLLVSPVLAPIWIAGLVALLLRRRLRRFRVFAVTWILLLLTFTATGGKPYYLAGMFPVLLAAGAIETEAWLERTRHSQRAALLWAMIALSGVVSALIALPLLPPQAAEPVIAMNSDAGETIGWPDLVRTVAAVYRRSDENAIILTANYGEAGAIDRYGSDFGLPQAYSGHNAFGYWGPPPGKVTTVITVGLGPRSLRSFRGCRLVTHISNSAGVDNDERGEPVELCTGTRLPWSTLWPKLKHLG